MKSLVKLAPSVYERGTNFYERYTKGVPFLSKMIYKRVRVWTSYKTWSSPPPPPPRGGLQLENVDGPTLSSFIVVCWKHTEDTFHNSYELYIFNLIYTVCAPFLLLPLYGLQGRMGGGGGGVGSCNPNEMN